MRSLLLGTACLAILAAPAVAQPPPGPFPTTATAQQVEPGRYWVFFDFDRSNLRNDARQVIAEAAASYKRTGAATILLVGGADRVGPTDYNRRLSERRAAAVRDELVRQGVPTNIISLRGEGYEAPIVPNPVGVKTPLNRYVAIVFPERERPPAPAAAAAPAPAPAPAPPQPRWAVSLGPWYGHNIKEVDGGGSTKSSNLVGAELKVEYAFTPRWVGKLDLVGYNTLDTSQSDGYGGLAAIGINHQWNFGTVHPYIGPRVGYIAGRGTQDGVVLGPELGLKVDVGATTFVYLHGGYLNNFRNEFDQGIINGGLGLGLRF